MKTYEMVREIENQCANNQMRDVFFDEVETDDPEAYVRGMLRGGSVTITVDELSPGRINIYADTDGMTQKFLFTEI